MITFEDYMSLREATGLRSVQIDHFQELPRVFIGDKLVIFKAQDLIMVVCTVDVAEKIGKMPNLETTFQQVWDFIRNNRTTRLSNGVKLTCGCNGHTCGDTPWENVVILPLSCILRSV